MALNKVFSESYKNIRNWKKYLNKNGFVILKGLEPNKKSMDFISTMMDRNIFISNYGEIWDTAGQIGNPTNDLAYSNSYLPPHTDLNYLKKNPKYQIFCCHTKAKKGGNTILVDGHQIYKIYKNNYLNYYKKLDEYYEFRCSEKKYYAKHKIYDNGIIHHNHNDMIPVDTKEYDTWNFLTNYYKFDFPLEKNETLILNNHRILHGRMKFEGYRNMVGCYLE